MVMGMHSVFVNLDREFQQDPTGCVLRQRTQQLEAGLKTYKSQLDAGVSEDEARALKNLISAYSAAIGVLPTLWKTQQAMET